MCEHPGDRNPAYAEKPSEIVFPCAFLACWCWLKLRILFVAVSVFYSSAWLIPDRLGFGFCFFICGFCDGCVNVARRLESTNLSTDTCHPPRTWKKKKINQRLLIWESVLEDIKYLRSFCEPINHDYCFKRPYILSILSASPAGAVCEIQMCLKAVRNLDRVETIRYVVTH